MVEILILYILWRFDATIYRIAKIIETDFCAFAKPSHGTINPALKRLESLGCVKFISNISEGGMRSNLYSITDFGEKYLKSQILGFSFENPSSLLNNAGILLFCSDVLSEAEREECFKNVSSHLNAHKAQVEQKLFDPYVDFSELQKAILKNSYAATDSLLALARISNADK
ncbi:PadR family transcriptional regulator [Candidatus Gastranaerophilus sp. (ex Termes propinquus)]|nr:PadR family transcriptional regulator [Candidatus Gastranaerophilus sp. (ex Termes propinquus)]